MTHFKESPTAVCNGARPKSAPPAASFPREGVLWGKVSRVIASWAIASWAIAPPASAQQTDEPLVDFGGAIFVEARHVQNANRTSVDEDQIEEVQLQYGASLTGSVDREIFLLSADYDFYQNEYLEDTQQSRFIRTGQSSLVFGTETTFYQVDISHSTQRFLTDRTGPSILANTDQRDITSATPLLRFHPGRGESNSIGVYGHYSDVRYKQRDINDSERMGYGLVLQRDTSPVHTLGLNFLESDVRYRYVDDADYRYRRAVVNFSGDLRLLDYRLDLGINEAAPDQGEKVDELYYNLSLSRTRYGSSWTFTANRTITDTSFGNANNPFFSEGITTDTSVTIQDQLEQRAFGLAWTSDFICRRCTFGLRAGYEDQQYFTETTEDQTEAIGGATFAYLVRPSAELQFLLDHRQRSFEDQGDYSETRATVALDIDPIFRHFDTRLWYQLEERNPEAGGSYYTGAVGLTVSYNF